MAGSYNHVVTNAGNLIGNKPPRGAPFSEMIENLGDAYECVEELFGMIWYLAASEHLRSGKDDIPVQEAENMKALVEAARENYKEGLTISKMVHRLSPDQRRS